MASHLIPYTPNPFWMESSLTENHLLPSVGYSAYSSRLFRPIRLCRCGDWLNSAVAIGASLGDTFPDGGVFTGRNADSSISKHLADDILLFFSSSEPKVVVVRPSTIFKQHILLNHWFDFDQTSQEWFLVGPLSKLFKWFRSIAYLVHRS